MKSFAFIFCPISSEQIKDCWPITKIIPGFLINALLGTSSFKIFPLKKIRSNQEKEIQGYFILCPALSKQGLKIAEEEILDKIIAAGQMAKQFGVSILGLDGVTSRLRDRGYILAEKLKMPLTNGNTLSAWSVFETIYRMSKVKNIELKKITLAVIGATDPIGSLCCRKLAEYVAKIIIVDRNRDKLKRLKETTLYLNPDIEVILEEDMRNALKDAEIIINTNYPSDTLFKIEELKLNSILCNVSLSKYKNNKRKDVTIIDNGLIKLPFSLNFRMNGRLPKNIVYASLAEVMLLTLQERFVNYSLGDNINLDKMEEIANIAVQHGFEVWAPDAPVL